MRRRPSVLVTLLVLLAWLAGGAIVNVAVAWGCAAWTMQRQPVSSSDEQFRSVSDLWGPLPLGTRSMLISRSACGFPIRSMEFFTRQSSIKEHVGGAWIGESLAAQLHVQQRYLPLRPIWPGFAINTAFYAVVLWLLFALGGLPFALRRRRRIRRGLCPKCAYDLRGRPERATACPECGAVVTPKEVSTT